MKAHDIAGMPEEKARTLNRRQRRILRNEGQPAVRTRRTGTTPHFAMWMADLKAKSALQRLKLDKLADALSAEQHALSAAFALCYVGGIKTVWALSQSRPKVKGVGPKRLAEIETYLRSQKVPVLWSVNGD